MQAFVTNCKWIVCVHMSLLLKWLGINSYHEYMHMFVYQLNVLPVYVSSYISIGYVCVDIL